MAPQHVYIKRRQCPTLVHKRYGKYFGPKHVSKPKQKGQRQCQSRSFDIFNLAQFLTVLAFPLKATPNIKSVKAQLENQPTSKLTKLQLCHISISLAEFQSVLKALHKKKPKCKCRHCRFHIFNFTDAFPIVLARLYEREPT